MIPFDDAYQRMISSRGPLPAAPIPLDAALGLVLAEAVLADMEMPPFPKSAMDGYACRKADLPGPLEVLEQIAAGVLPEQPIGPGQCAKIMTGAPVPDGADCVIMVEHTEAAGENRIRFTKARTEENICQQGEDMRRGDEVLAAGCVIEARHIAVLASVGCVTPRLIRRARVGVLATGNEIIDPARTPAAAQIRNSNSPQLCAQIRVAGGVARDYGIAGDTREALDPLLGQALAENDLVLVSGGVSMGDYDLVPASMRANGLEILFDRVAIKPGKPSTYAIREDAACFGLPGNPVSTFIQFHLMVAPLLARLMGRPALQEERQLPLANEYHRKKVDRENWLPATINANGAVELCRYHGSAHIHALCSADVIIRIPRGVAELAAGDQVDARFL